MFDQADPTLSPAQVRSLCREDSFRSGGTPGYCPGYTQANVLILPSRYANDFRTFCQRNPVSCPLLGETAVGDPAVPSSLAKSSDIRTDCGQYCVYENGKLQNVKRNLMDEWTNESVGFLIGCSYSFEGALLADGFGLRHVEERKVLPVYKTSVQLMPAGVFSGRMVVSMRPYPLKDVPRIIELCRPFSKAHGEPVGWGEEGAHRLGITDVDGKNPDWGSSVTIKEGEVPVYWACGVTPQQVVMDSQSHGTIKGNVFSHKAGYMLVLDVKSEYVCS